MSHCMGRRNSRLLFTCCPASSPCLQGDNDPVDVVEISSAAHKQGGVYKVKPLGVYAMIDDGELDWKVRYM